MSEASVKARAAMKSKAHRMAEGSSGKVDASDWSPDTFSAEKKTGKRPVNPREYKRGGKVMEHISGEAPSSRNATKMSRHPTHGCRIGNKEGNYDGGTRPTGGRIAKADGGEADKKPNLLKDVGSFIGGGALPGLIASNLKTGGRVARKHGGKTGKGKTNINIIIGGGRDRESPPPPPAMQPGPIHPPGMFPPGLPPGAGAGAPPPMPMPPPTGAGMAGMMPRKAGGRAVKNMTAGAGSGEGRLQKIGETP